MNLQIRPDYPYVLFKLPGSKKFYFLIQKNQKTYRAADFNMPGFYMAPFDLDRHPVYIIPLAHARFSSHDLPVRTTEKLHINPEPISSPSPGSHEKKVARAIEHIRSDDQLKKIVISSYQDYNFDRMDPVKFFFRLAETHPEAFVFYWHHPSAGFSWAGASPEPLFSFTKNPDTSFYHAETVSLAGTKFSDENRNWTPKEIEEQKIVTDYIKQKLFELKLAVSSYGPYDFAQAHLIHLKTDLSFIFPDENDFINQIIRALHPTPAVAGMTKEAALKIIPGIENYDREYYTGFFGFRQSDKGLFHVNLRSARITPHRLRLYAGGGITQESLPAQEWQEVQRKWDVIKKIFTS